MIQSRRAKGLIELLGRLRKRDFQLAAADVLGILSRSIISLEVFTSLNVISLVRSEILGLFLNWFWRFVVICHL